MNESCLPFFFIEELSAFLELSAPKSFRESVKDGASLLVLVDTIQASSLIVSESPFLTSAMPPSLLSLRIEALAVTSDIESI
jgi:hypothetical protein